MSRTTAYVLIVAVPVAQTDAGTDEKSFIVGPGIHMDVVLAMLQPPPVVSVIVTSPPPLWSAAMNVAVRSVVEPTNWIP